MEISTEQHLFEPLFSLSAANPGTGGEAYRQAQQPRVGTVVMVAHALGAGAVPAELEGSGFEVVVATDSETALDTGAARADVAVVDARFEGDGLAFCERLWALQPGFPVLVIGPNDESLVTRALGAGADDYLVQPLRNAELVARVRAVLRRVPRSSGAGRSQDRVLQVGDVCLDPESHEVTLRSARLHLPLREFELLRLLMENAGIVLPRATLMGRLWGPSAPPDSTSLEVHVRRLRSKLESDPAAPRRIVTVRGIGYRYEVER